MSTHTLCRCSAAAAAAGGKEGTDEHTRACYNIKICTHAFLVIPRIKWDGGRRRRSSSSSISSSWSSPGAEWRTVEEARIRCESNVAVSRNWVAA